MRVAFDGTIFGLQRVGGVSTYAWEMIRGLAAFPGLTLTLGLPSTVISDIAGAIDALPLTIERERLPVKLARYLPSPLRHADIFHSPYYRAPLGGSGKRVITVHDFVYERYRDGLPRWIHHWQKAAALRSADAVVCVSESTAIDLGRYCPFIDPARVTIIPHGVDPATFFVSPTPRRDLADSIVFIGQRGGYKRFDLAVAAVALTGWRLGIVGHAVDAAERELLDRRLPGRWQQFGRIDDAALRDIYAGARGFIYPSDYEGFGLPILEAQACGCPAVVANRSSFPEVGGDAALYAPEQIPESYAALLASLGDDECRAAIVAAGLENAARFSWEQTTAATLALYRRLL